jgi:hypothetical protein
MISLSSRQLILLGFFLVFFGFLIPLLMTAHIIEATLFLSFLSYGASVVGLMLGILGAANYVRGRWDE